MQAFVNVPRARGHYQYNTQPMDRDAAIEYAYSVSKQGRNAIVLRAAPVTPGLTPRQSLERHESFLTSDVIAEFRAQGD